MSVGAGSGTLRGLLRPSRRDARIVSPFEFWPGWMMYTPVVLQWILLGVRHGDFSLPSAANPHIETGGLCGESKTGILDLGGPRAQAAIAPYTSFLTARAADPAADLAAAEAARAARGIAYPLVLKPDIGCNGTGVRLIETPERLAAALPLYPRGVRMMLQELVTDEGEAGIFYSRHPDAPRGRITSLTLKHAPAVTGDGRSTLEALIRADPRAGLVPHLYLPRLADRLGEVPAAGERVRLVFTGNHCKGATFVNGCADITESLTDAVDAIARDMRDFHFGRIDVRYASLGALRRGEGFRIIEINGVGSEATHIWDPSTTLREAYFAQFRHYREAFEIGRAMRRLGHRTSGSLTMLRLWRLQRRLLAAYPIND